jgi:hypothetical protein
MQDPPHTSVLTLRADISTISSLNCSLTARLYSGVYTDTFVIKPNFIFSWTLEALPPSVPVRVDVYDVDADNSTQLVNWLSLSALVNGRANGPVTLDSHQSLLLLLLFFFFCAPLTSLTIAPAAVSEFGPPPVHSYIVVNVTAACLPDYYTGLGLVAFVFLPALIKQTIKQTNRCLQRALYTNGTQVL